MRWREQSGWTMVEMVLVVAVIGLVAAYTLPKLLGANNQANNRSAEIALQQAASAATQWAKSNQVDTDCAGAEAERCDGGYAGLTIGALQATDRSFVQASGSEVPGGQANPYAVKWQAVPQAPYLLVMCTAGKSSVYCLGQDVQSTTPGHLGVGASSHPAMWRSNDRDKLPDPDDPPSIDDALSAMTEYVSCTVSDPDGYAGCELPDGYPIALLPNPGDVGDPGNDADSRIYQAWAPTS